MPAAPWRGQNVLSLAAATLLPPPALHFDDWSSTPGTGTDRPPVISHLHFPAVAQMGRWGAGGTRVGGSLTLLLVSSALPFWMRVTDFEAGLPTPYATIAFGRCLG